jgi:hypothetical protein
MARFALYPNTVQISQLPPSPPWGTRICSGIALGSGDAAREIRGINSFNPRVLPSIVPQVPLKARQVR